MSKIRPFLRAIRKSHDAKIVRFGVVTPEAYIVTNIRFAKDQIDPSRLERQLLDKKGRLTSIGLKLPDRSYLNITRTPSLHLGYRGKLLDFFLKSRNEFEQLSLRG